METPSIEGVEEYTLASDPAIARLEFKEDEATSLGTDTSLSPQSTTMTAFNYGELPITTSPLHTVSFLELKLPLPPYFSPLWQDPTSSHGGYVPRLKNAEPALSHTPKSLINAPAHQGKTVTVHETGTDELPRQDLWKGTKNLRSNPRIRYRATDINRIQNTTF